uniref:Cyclin N-terminal domain-containing protein n=1 Tax=Timema genevievae TaxID=629358 RepID=A0A7R9JTG9_TIMGE|nr:unnamed protein product [Timema genevievae]
MSSVNVKQVAMATAQVLFQRFYYSKSFVRHAMETTSMGCLCLASKIEEAPRRIRDVINVLQHVKQVKGQRTIQPIVLDQNYIALKTQVIKAERRVLKELGFCVHVRHPHKPNAEELEKRVEELRRYYQEARLKARVSTSTGNISSSQNFYSASGKRNSSPQSRNGSTSTRSKDKHHNAMSPRQNSHTLNKHRSRSRSRTLSRSPHSSKYTKKSRKKSPRPGQGHSLDHLMSEKGKKHIKPDTVILGRHPYLHTNTVDIEERKVTTIRDHEVEKVVV